MADWKWGEWLDYQRWPDWFKLILLLAALGAIGWVLDLY